MISHAISRSVVKFIGILPAFLVLIISSSAQAEDKGPTVLDGFYDGDLAGSGMIRFDNLEGCSSYWAINGIIHLEVNLAKVYGGIRFWETASPTNTNPDPDPDAIACPPFWQNNFEYGVQLQAGGNGALTGSDVNDSYSSYWRLQMSEDCKTVSGTVNVIRTIPGEVGVVAVEVNLEGKGLCLKKSLAEVEGYIKAANAFRILSFAMSAKSLLELPISADAYVILDKMFASTALAGLMVSGNKTTEGDFLTQAGRNHLAFMIDAFGVSMQCLTGVGCPMAAVSLSLSLAAIITDWLAKDPPDFDYTQLVQSDYQKMEKPIDGDELWAVSTPIINSVLRLSDAFRIIVRSKEKYDGAVIDESAGIDTESYQAMHGSQIMLYSEVAHEQIELLKTLLPAFSSLLVHSYPRLTSNDGSTIMETQFKVEEYLSSSFAIPPEMLDHFESYGIGETELIDNLQSGIYANLPSSPFEIELVLAISDLVDSLGGLADATREFTSDIALRYPYIPTTKLEEKIQELYVGILGRAADRPGLDYWLDEINSGALTLENTRASFTHPDQSEYTEIYGGLDNTLLVTATYENFLERAPEAAGLLYWVGELDAARVNPDQMINAVINAVQDSNASGEDAAKDLTTLSNKVEAAKYFTTQTEDYSFDAAYREMARAVVANVTDDPETLIQAKAMIDEYVGN